jgi:hypothetical protein
MHRLHAKQMITRFRISSLLFLLMLLVPVVALPLLAMGWFWHDPVQIYSGVAVLVSMPVVSVTQWIVSSRARCPLCMTTVLADKSCSKHREARRLLGSFRLRVALSILFRNHFHCPYCGEPTAMQVRERRTR